ncbi:MAG: hypothetical protein IJM59_02475, partial [Proteobacteria bacterium]|nr:hypothetical protein [Pseudomonadota bacterium]
MSNKKLALFFACCAAAGITATACNESAEWKPDVVECTNDAQICQNNTVKKCVDGAWVDQEVCSGATPICNSTTYTCVAQTSPSCTNGDVKCDNNILLQCVNGQWNATPCNSAQTCDVTSKSCKENGEAAECEADAVKCEADAENEGKATMFSCADGKWVKGDACDEGMVCGTDDAGKAACVSGESEKCEADAVKCEADADNDNTPTLYNCDADGNWVKGDACEEGMICGTDEAGKAACVAAAEECVPGCVDNVLTTCGDDGKVVKNCADDFMICGKDGEGEDAVDACVLDPDVKYCAEYELADGTKKSIAADKEICDGAKIVKCTIPDDATEAVEATVETDCAVDAEGNATGKVCGPMSEEDASLACVEPTIEPEKCEADAIKCEEDANNDNKPTMFKCNADGAWEVDVACAEGELCGKKTDGDTEVDACVEPVKCTIDGDTTEYEHGAKRCDEAVVKVCNGGTGAWDTDTDCAANADLPVCLEGACVACIAEDTKCVAEKDTNDVWSHKLFTCTAENTWGEGVACTDGKVCDTATPSKECKDPKDLLVCAANPAEQEYCQSIYDEMWLAICANGSASEYSESCTAQSLVCSADTQSCAEPAAGCKAEDACNATVLEGDSCGQHFQDIYATGDIKCNEACSEVDYSACKYCGDGEIQTAQGEQCEGTDIGTATCADVDPNKTWKEGGVPACEGCVLVAGTCEEETTVACTADTDCVDAEAHKQGVCAGEGESKACDYTTFTCIEGWGNPEACDCDLSTNTWEDNTCKPKSGDTCAADSECVDGHKQGVCTGDPKACDYTTFTCIEGWGNPEACDCDLSTNTWEENTCKPNETCTDDDNSCTDTETGSTVVTCTDGKKTETTSEFSCKDPKTVGVCKNGDTKCDDGKLSTCAKGAWGEGVECIDDHKVGSCTGTACDYTSFTCETGWGNPAACDCDLSTNDWVDDTCKPKETDKCAADSECVDGHKLGSCTG